jgi:hypothetical protein
VRDGRTDFGDSARFEAHVDERRIGPAAPVYEMPVDQPLRLRMRRRYGRHCREKQHN